MKAIFSSRRNKTPHNNEGKEKNETSFFSKEPKQPFFNVANGEGAVQTKLTVGQPGDKYEQEADKVADAVVNNTSKPDIQNKELNSIQRESLATPVDEEKLGTAEQRMEEDKLVQEKPEIQKMEESKEEEMVNKKGEPEEEEEMISKKGEPEEEEEMISKMDEPEEEGEEMISKMEGEEEEEVLQTKSNTSNNQTVSNQVSNKIKNKSGYGRKMSEGTKNEMESSFGKDFSGVNIHTDQDATDMNRELHAQAFTHGSDIYFNSGKYSPETTEGKRLLAHELTHVIQQSNEVKKKGETIQKKGKKSFWKVHIPLLHDKGSDYKKISLKFDGRSLHVFGDGKKLQSLSAQSGKFESVDDATKKKCSGGLMDRYLNNPKYVGIKNKGPIPEGTYTFKPKSIQDFTIKDQGKLMKDMLSGKKNTKTSQGNVKTGDWGQGRVHLIPVSRTIKKGPCGDAKNRNAFFLHGGVLPGSAGCIDVGSFFGMLSKFLSTHKKTIKLEVAYSNKGKWIPWL